MGLQLVAGAHDAARLVWIWCRRDCELQNAGRGAELSELYRRSPFFRTIVSNLEMVLAKSNLEIGERYAELVEDPNTRQPYLLPYFDGMVGHHRRGVDAHRAEAVCWNRIPRCPNRYGFVCPISTP